MIELALGQREKNKDGMAVLLENIMG
jgi:hypothetical protein